MCQYSDGFIASGKTKQVETDRVGHQTPGHPAIRGKSVQFVQHSAVKDRTAIFRGLPPTARSREASGVGWLALAFEMS